MKRFDVDVRASSNLFDLYQSDETIRRLKDYLMGMNSWQLNGNFFFHNHFFM